MSSFSGANGVRHTEKISSYTRNLTKKKEAWFVTQSENFYLKKSSIINEFTHKIKTVFFPNSIHNLLPMAVSLIVKYNFSNIFTYLAAFFYYQC